MTVWCAGLETCTPNDHLHRVTYARCRADTIISPVDGHMGVPKHVENRNKRI